MEQLLELGCKQQVFKLVKKALGDPESPDEQDSYWGLTSKIMSDFKSVRSRAKDKLNTGDMDDREVLEIYLKTINDPDNEEEDEDEWPISRSISTEIYQLLKSHHLFEVKSFIKTQAKLQSEKAAAQQAATTADGALGGMFTGKQMSNADASALMASTINSNTKANVVLTPEDRYAMLLIAQQEGGLVDRTALINEEILKQTQEPEEEIELTEIEPVFLRGQVQKRNQTFYHNTRQQTRTAFGAELKQLNKLARIDEYDTRTEMQKVADRQDDMLKMRRQAFGGNSKSQNDTAAAAATPTGDDPVSEKPQALDLELGELPEENDPNAGMKTGGVGRATGTTSSSSAVPLAATKDQLVKGAAPPPWMKPSSLSSGSGSGVAFGPQSSMSIQQVRESLPIFAHKDRIIEHVLNNRVTVLVGFTGSGKTTQLTQYMMDAGLHKTGLIGCTQPRKLAATSVAERVAEEYGCPLGEEVGFSVRNRKKFSRLTKILYMTDGMLLREAQTDEVFSRYSIIILDEAHERGVNTDVLFGLIKKAMRKRADLRLIVTSATLETEKFCKFFDAKEPLEIPGRTFDVTTIHEDLCDDYLETATRIVMDIHLTKGRGDILVFLTGAEEIHTAAQRLHNWCEQLQELPDGIPELIICEVYSAQPNEVQSKVFERIPAGSKARKVVLATNIAETSITIPDLYYVVDSGYCKMKRYNPRTGVEQLKVVPISQSQAKQRMGRAGRTGPGMCYRLYSEKDFFAMSPSTEPEIQRCNLIQIVLTLKSVGVGDIMSFEFMDKPDTKTLVAAQQRLFYLQALDEMGNLTPFGRKMSSLPVEPTLARTLLTAKDMKCLPSVLIAVAMLMSNHAIFHRPRDKEAEAKNKHAQFSHYDGDQLTLVSVYNAWVNVGKESMDWCRANFVNFAALREARENKAQLEQLLKSTMGGAGNTSLIDDGVNTTKQVSAGNQATIDEQEAINVRKALTAGYFFQAAKRMSDGRYRTLTDRREVFIHPGSSLRDIKPKYVVYHVLEKINTKECMKDVMNISPGWLVELAPAYYGRAKAGTLTAEQRAQRIEPQVRFGEKVRRRR